MASGRLPHPHAQVDGNWIPWMRGGVLRGSREAGGGGRGEDKLKEFICLKFLNNELKEKSRSVRYNYSI